MADASMEFPVSSEKPPSTAPDVELVHEAVSVSREMQAVLLQAETLGSRLDELLREMDETSSDQAVADLVHLDAELVRRVRSGEPALTLLTMRYLDKDEFNQ